MGLHNTDYGPRKSDMQMPPRGNRCRVLYLRTRVGLGRVVTAALIEPQFIGLQSPKPAEEVLIGSLRNHMFMEKIHVSALTLNPPLAWSPVDLRGWVGPLGGQHGLASFVTSFRIQMHHKASHKRCVLYLSYPQICNI
jgi:hypothetical protein